MGTIHSQSSALRGATHSTTTTTHNDVDEAQQREPGFGPAEHQLLGRVFESLAALSKGATMDKDTFLRYFKFPGMFGERVFALFDQKKNGVIDAEEFLNGMSVYMSASMNDKIHLLFRLYDLTGDQHVSPAELSCMLYSLMQTPHMIPGLEDLPGNYGVGGVLLVPSELKTSPTTSGTETSVDPSTNRSPSSRPASPFDASDASTSTPQPLPVSAATDQKHNVNDKSGSEGVDVHDETWETLRRSHLNRSAALVGILANTSTSKTTDRHSSSDSPQKRQVGGCSRCGNDSRQCVCDGDIREFSTLIPSESLIQNASPNQGMRNLRSGRLARRGSLAMPSMARIDTHIAPQPSSLSVTSPHEANFVSVVEDDAYLVERTVQRVFSQCDLDGNGRLSYEEFSHWISKYPQVFDAMDEQFLKHVWMLPTTPNVTSPLGDIALSRSHSKTKSTNSDTDSHSPHTTLPGKLPNIVENNDVDEKMGTDSFYLVGTSAYLRAQQAHIVSDFAATDGCWWEFDAKECQGTYFATSQTTIPCPQLQGSANDNNSHSSLVSALKKIGRYNPRHTVGGGRPTQATKSKLRGLFAPMNDENADKTLQNGGKPQESDDESQGLESSGADSLGPWGRSSYSNRTQDDVGVQYQSDNEIVDRGMVEEIYKVLYGSNDTLKVRSKGTESTEEIAINPHSQAKRHISDESHSHSPAKSSLSSSETAPFASQDSQKTRTSHQIKLDLLQEHPWFRAFVKVYRPFYDRKASSGDSGWNMEGKPTSSLQSDIESPEPQLFPTHTEECTQPHVRTDGNFCAPLRIVSPANKTPRRHNSAESGEKNGSDEALSALSSDNGGETTRYDMLTPSPTRHSPPNQSMSRPSTALPGSMSAHTTRPRPVMAREMSTPGPPRLQKTNSGRPPVIVESDMCDLPLENVWEDVTSGSKSHKFSAKPVRSERRSRLLRGLTGSNRYGYRPFRWRYYVLRGSFLYVFLEKGAKRPENMLFVEGMFVEPQDKYQPQGYYGFSLKAFKSWLHFYCRSPELRDRWLRALRQAAHTMPIEAEYKVGHVIGKGQFADVLTGTHLKTRKPFAIKKIFKKMMNEASTLSLRAEIGICKLLSHPFLLKLHDTFEDANHVYLVLDMCPDGDMFEFIMDHGALPEHVCGMVVEQLLKAVSYLHRRGIVHRDIKPSNVLIRRRVTSKSEPSAHETLPPGEKKNDGPIPDVDPDTTSMTVKLIDFGLSKFSTPKEKMSLSCGSVCFVAPEVLGKSGYQHAVDIWGVGVVLYFLLGKGLPFWSDRDDDQEVIRQILHTPVKFAPKRRWDKISDAAKDLIRALLTKDPRKRITIDEALRHPFIEQSRRALSTEIVSASPPVQMQYSDTFSAPLRRTTSSTDDSATQSPVPSASTKPSDRGTTSPTQQQCVSSANKHTAVTLFCDEYLASPGGLRKLMDTIEKGRAGNAKKHAYLIRRRMSTGNNIIDNHLPARLTSNGAIVSSLDNESGSKSPVRAVRVAGGLSQGRAEGFAPSAEWIGVDDLIQSPEVPTSILAEELGSPQSTNRGTGSSLYAPHPSPLPTGRGDYLPSTAHDMPSLELPRGNSGLLLNADDLEAKHDGTDQRNKVETVTVDNQQLRMRVHSASSVCDSPVICSSTVRKNGCEEVTGWQSLFDSDSSIGGD